MTPYLLSFKTTSFVLMNRFIIDVVSVELSEVLFESDTRSVKDVLSLGSSVDNSISILLLLLSVDPLAGLFCYVSTAFSRNIDSS